MNNGLKRLMCTTKEVDYQQSSTSYFIFPERLVIKTHPNYLSYKPISSSKSGLSYNFYNADGKSQLNLYNLGYQYYCKSDLPYFGTNVLFKVIQTEVIDGVLFCLCENTIKFKYLIAAQDLIKNND